VKTLIYKLTCNVSYATTYNFRGGELFDILATGRLDLHSKLKETLLIREVQPALNENVENVVHFAFKFICNFPNGHF